MGGRGPETRWRCCSRASPRAGARYGVLGASLMGMQLAGGGLIVLSVVALSVQGWRPRQVEVS